MQNFRPFPPCFLQEMPRNPTFDSFHEVKIVPKLEKSTDRGHKLNSSEGGQDTPVCKISSYSLHAFSRKCQETPNLTRFTKSKWCQTEENQQTVTINRKLLRTDGRTCCKMVTVGRVDQRTHVQVERGYFRLRTGGRLSVWTNPQHDASLDG